MKRKVAMKDNKEGGDHDVREEQRILNRQDDEGQTIWDAPESPLPRPTTTRSKKRRATKVWRKVASSFSSNSPGRAEQW